MRRCQKGLGSLGGGGGSDHNGFGAFGPWTVPVVGGK